MKPGFVSRAGSVFWIATALFVAIPYAVTTHAGPQPTEHLIEIRGFEYEVLQAVPKPGDTVTWLNRDIAPHTATAADGSWSTAELRQGESESITVTADMQADYYCRYHPSMKSALPSTG